MHEYNGYGLGEAFPTGVVLLAAASVHPVCEGDEEGSISNREDSGENNGGMVWNQCAGKWQRRWGVIFRTCLRSCAVDWGAIQCDVDGEVARRKIGDNRRTSDVDGYVVARRERDLVIRRRVHIIRVIVVRFCRCTTGFSQLMSVSVIVMSNPSSPTTN